MVTTLAWLDLAHAAGAYRADDLIRTELGAGRGSHAMPTDCTSVAS